MTAIANAMAAHGGLRPYVAGFFVFADYMKPAMRLSALMKLPVVYVMTHDSIGVGEDGPTHQPVEQLAMLRSIPNFTVIRPCDTHETAVAWAQAMKRTTSPTALVLSRQSLPLLKETAHDNGPDIFKGAYIIKENVNASTGKPDVILIGTGSEVSLCYKAADMLLNDGIHARVVSMPSMEIFEEQTPKYKEKVLPPDIRARVAVEAALPFGWHKYIGLDGAFIGVDGFGASAPAGTVFKEYGITVEAVVSAAKKVNS
jgi:transketolase